MALSINDQSSPSLVSSVASAGLLFRPVAEFAQVQKGSQPGAHLWWTSIQEPLFQVPQLIL